MSGLERRFNRTFIDRGKRRRELQRNNASYRAAVNARDGHAAAAVAPSDVVSQPGARRKAS